MNINLSEYKLNMNEGYNNTGVNNNVNNLSNNISNTNSINNSSVALGQNILQSLQPGAEFNGEIQNIINDMVTIKLDNNSMFTARLLENVNINIGDSISFSVKENNGNSLVINPSNNDNSKLNEMLGKILENTGLSPSEKNYAVAEILIKNNMPVDKNEMQKILQASYKFPNASLEDIVALDKMGIPITDNNLNQYNLYKENQHQIINEINELSQQYGEYIVDVNSDEISGSELLNNNIKHLESLLSGEKADIFNLENISDKTTFKEYVDNIFNLDSKISSDFFDLLEKNGVDFDKLQKNFADLSNNKELAKTDILKYIFSQIDNDTMLKELLQKDEYKEFVKDLVKGELSLNGDKMKNPEEIDQLYEKLLNKTNQLINDFSSGNSSNKQDFSQTARDLQGKIAFMQELNQNYTYAQLPVRFSGDDINSELFVYMNKKSMSINKKDISAMLHLDMENLGPTDVHVTLNGDYVTTKFYVEDEESARILDEHMTMLEKSLNTIGYNLNNEVVLRDKTISNSNNFVNKEIVDDNMEQSVRRFSFDIRA